MISSWSCRVLTLEGEGLPDAGRVHHQLIGSVVDTYLSCSQGNGIHLCNPGALDGSAFGQLLLESTKCDNAVMVMVSHAVML